MKQTYRGHKIELDPGTSDWYYVDTGEFIQGAKRGWCGHCGDYDTPEGHDGCIGEVKGLMNACCGHGEAQAAYAQFPDGTTIEGEAVQIYFKVGDAMMSPEVKKLVKEANFMQARIEAILNELDYEEAKPLVDPYAGLIKEIFNQKIPNILKELNENV